MKTTTLWVGLMVGTAALADGIPQSEPLAYSGVLEESGAPVTGQRELRVVLWNDATLSAPANKRCETVPPAPIQVTNGNFRVVLDATCVTAVQQTPELWVEVVVQNQSLGRAKLGAVPYAVEAARASDAAGPLKAAVEGASRYTNPTTNGSVTVNGSYCGLTVPVTGLITTGTSTGYPAAKQLCEQTCSRPTAHVCSPDEVLRFVSTGGQLPLTGTSANARLASGSYAVIGLSFSNTSFSSSTDCLGWTSSSSGSGLAWTWSTTTRAGYPFSVGCAQSSPLLCCN